MTKALLYLFYYYRTHARTHADTRTPASPGSTARGNERRPWRDQWRAQHSHTVRTHSTIFMAVCNRCAYFHIELLTAMSFSIVLWVPTETICKCVRIHEIFTNDTR